MHITTDVGFGNAITPGPSKRDIPCIIDLPSPRLPVHSWETVVSETFEAIVGLDIWSFPGPAVDALYKGGAGTPQGTQVVRGPLSDTENPPHVTSFSSQPARNRGLMNSLALSLFLNFRFSASHSSFWFGKRQQIVPSSSHSA